MSRETKTKYMFAIKRERVNARFRHILNEMEDKELKDVNRNRDNMSYDVHESSLQFIHRLEDLLDGWDYYHMAPYLPEIHEKCAKSANTFRATNEQEKRKMFVKLQNLVEMLMEIRQ